MIQVLSHGQIAFKSVWTKYEEANHAMKNDQEKFKEENLTNQLGIQINQLKSKVAEINGTLNFLDKELRECVIKAENIEMKGKKV